MYNTYVAMYVPSGVGLLFSLPLVELVVTVGNVGDSAVFGEFSRLCITSST